MSSSRITTYIANQARVLQPLTALVFMNFTDHVIPIGKDPHDNVFTRALDEYGKNVTEVAIKYTPDLLDPLCFSALIKHLTKLKKITFWDNLTPSECQSLIPQLNKCLLKGIKLILPPALNEHIRMALFQFLKENNQADFAQELMKPRFEFGELKDEEFSALVNAYNAATEFAEIEKKDTDDFSTMYSDYNIQIQKQLLKDYLTGEGFDNSSPWFENRPKDIALFDFTGKPRQMFTLYALATKLNLWPLLAQGFGTRSSVFFANHKQLTTAIHDPAILALEMKPGELQQCIKMLIAMAAKGSFNAYQEAAVSKKKIMPM